jgi:hypothetical protein
MVRVGGFVGLRRDMMRNTNDAHPGARIVLCAVLPAMLQCAQVVGGGGILGRRQRRRRRAKTVQYLLLDDNDRDNQQIMPRGKT